MKLKSWGITLGFCFSVLLGLTIIKGIQINSAIAAAESFPEHSESVESITSQTELFTQTQMVFGEVIAGRQVTLFSELAGRITLVGFNSGEKVKKGQLLLQLDVSEEQSLLDSAKARLDLANSIYQRNKRLLEANAVSREQYDRTRVEQLTAQAEITRLESVIRKKTVKAAFTGITGIHRFEVGQFLQANTKITELVAESNYRWIDFNVPQFYPRLEKGDRVEVKLLRNSNVQNNTWVAATVIARSAQLTKESRSYRYRAKVPVTDFIADVNSGVSVRVPTSVTSEYIAVPVTSVQKDSYGAFVYLLTPDDSDGAFRATRQEVTVASTQENVIYLSKGLIAGQLIAGDGAFKLYPSVLTYTQDQHNTQNKDNTRSNLDEG